LREIREITFFTHDLAATTFYERLFDTAPIHRDAGIALFTLGSLRILIHVICERGEADLPFDDHFALPVTDLDTVAASLRSQGLQFENDPRAYSWGRSAYLRDPDGRLLELHESASQ
jgi:catechol 2,3-dioxygenase-like lactoylglutathione lyase family enzyme